MVSFGGIFVLNNGGEDGDKGELLLRCADIAMYNAKAHGGNNFCFYSPEIDHNQV